jgi:hypothetical protein
MRPSTPQRLRDLRKNLLVKLVAVIPGFYSPSNNRDIEGVPTRRIFAFLLLFRLHALFVSVGSPTPVSLSEPSGCHLLAPLAWVMPVRH